MPDSSGQTSAIPPLAVQPSGQVFPSKQEKAKLSLAEAYYQGHLEDLAAHPESGKLEQFILEIFGAQARLVSDAQKLKLGRQLLEWAAAQSNPIRTQVWKSFASCHWILPVLEIMEKLSRHQRRALLDVDPRVLVEVIEPYLADRPGKILSLSTPSIEERQGPRRS